MARRRYQRGALVLKGTGRKKWVLQIREDVQVSGEVKRRLKSEFVGWLEDLPTKQLARRKADVLLAKAGINDIDYRPKLGVTLAEIVELFKELGMTGWAEGSVIKANEHLRLHILPQLGHLPLYGVSNLEIQRAIVKWSEKLNEHSIRNVMGTLSQVFTAAKNWDYPAKRWDSEAISIPKDTEPKRDTAFTVDEIRKIIEWSPNPWRAIYALGGLGALRGEEILALHWEDVDLINAKLKVRWALGAKRTMKIPKTDKSRRTIPIAPPLLDILKAHRAEWKHNDAGLVFAVKTGRPMSHSKILEKRLYPLLAKLGIAQRGLHAFRHTSISLLIEEGVPLPLVQQIVGHEHIETTLRIYAHVIRPEHRAALVKLSGVLMSDDAADLNKALRIN